MTSESTKAREAAQHCEAIKYAYRQTKEGVVVSFVLHPSDVPASLQLSPIGARYLLALVEIGEDETPVNRKDGDAPGRVQKPESSSIDTSPPSVSPSTPSRAGANNSDKKRIKQAGMAAADPVFQAFLYELEYSECKNEECAAAAIRKECGVISRAEIIPGTEAAHNWDRLWSRFMAWKVAA